MTTNTYMNFAKRLVMVLAVGMMAVNVWGAYSGTFNRISSLSDISSGDSVLIVIQDAKTTTSGYAVQNNSTNYASVTISDGPSISCTNNSLVWKVNITEGQGNNPDTYTFTRGTGNSVKYILWSSSTTLNANGSSTDGTTTWTIDPIENYAGYFTINSTGTGNRYIGWNSAFKAFATSNFLNQFATEPAVALKQYHGAVSIYKKGAATHTVTINRNNNAYGTVSQASVANLANNTDISASDNVLTIGTTTVTATPTAQDADYNYAFSSWGGIPAGGKVTGNITVTANFTRTARTYVNYRTRCCAKLDAPTNVEVEVTGTQAATVTWDGVENASGYEYTLDAGENWTAATSPLSLTSAQGLEGATSYAIQVRATGDGTTYCADGTAADAVNFKTWSTVTAASNDALMGSAQVSLTSGSGWASSVAAADGTKIYLKATATGDSYEWYEWATPASGSINGDNEFTGWEGDVTVTANFRTKSLTKLDTPTGMESSSVTAISAVVSWTAVDHASGYTVTCEKTSDGSTTGIVIGDVDGTSCTISGLTANTGYTWTVKAVGDNSSYKDGDACEGQTFTTDKKKPATVEITTTPSKTTYNSGETFVADGMVVKVTYNNGDIDLNYGDYTISKTTALSPSDTYVTITATLNEVSASVNQAIIVNAKLTWKAAGAEDVYTYASGGKVVMPTGDNPAAPSCLGDFDTFQGWSASAIAVSTTTEPSYVSEETAATADHTYYAVFAKMGEGDEEDAYSVFTVNAEAPGSPYVASDGATWTYSSSNITFNNGNSSKISQNGWAQVVLPANATKAVNITVTKTGNTWAAAATMSLKSGETNITDITKNATSYDFTNSNNSLGTYKLTTTSSNDCWIDHITINYKKVGQVPVEWATTCCTEWSAPEISYSVPSGWKNGDAAVSIEIAEGDTYGSVSYESSNTDVLTVNETTGAITAVAPGTATVTATWAGATVSEVKYCEASSTSATITVTGTLTIQFVGGTGTTGSMDNQTVTYNAAEAISNNGFSKAGYTFAGWALTDGGEKAYDNQQSVAFTENTTLYALWSLNHHNVTLTQPTVSEVAAGTIKVNNSTTSPASVDYGTTVTLTATENEGYAFDSWSVTGASLASAATVKDNSFTMPDNDVTVTATYHAYTWDLTSYEVTSEVQLSYTDVETFDKNGVVVKANYERSDTKETKQETYEGTWTAKLGDDVINHDYAFALADNGKHLTFWVGENKFFDEEVAVAEITKDHFVDKLWDNAEIIRSGENYDMPSLENGAEGGSEATCKDHRFFMGWVLATNDENPTDNLIAATGKQSVADEDRTFYAVWAKNVEHDLAAGYRQITSAPAGGDSVILAALSGTKYYAVNNDAENSNAEITFNSGAVSNPNGFGFKVESSNSGKKFQTGSKYIHFNGSSFKVANGDNNGLATLTAVDGAFKIKGNANTVYMTFNGTSFGVTSTEANYTPIYIFKKQAAGKETVKGDYITDCTPRHTISFNVNGGKGSYEDVLKKEGATITLPVPAEAEYKDWHTYAGWKVNNAGDLLETTYTVGNSDVTLYAQWNEVSKADVIFKDGETTVQTLSGIHQGESYNLKAALEAEGKQFTGWKNGSITYDAGKAMTMGTPAADSIYVAQWMTVVPTPTPSVIETADLSNGEWVLVTTASQINSGDVVILAANGYDYALGTQGGYNYRSNETIVKTTDKSKLTNIGSAAKLFVQNGYDEGQFALYDMNTTSGENGYLYHSGSGNTLNTETSVVKNGSWKISVADGVATIQSAGTDYYLKYNGTNPRFSCYSSGQSAVALYKWVKKITGTTPIDVSTVTLTDAVIVTDGATLNVPADATLDNVIVENGGKVTVAENKSLEVNDFVIEASQVDGKSGQVTGAGVLTVTGEAYFELKVAAEHGVTAGWYTFAVPFSVDALNGVYYGNTKLVNEKNYAIMAYDGEVRATGKYGWKKYRGILQPGTMYTITLGNTDYNVLRFRKAEGSVVAENEVALHKYPLNGGNTGDNGWNAVANPNLYYSSCSMSVAEKVQYYDHESNTFSPDDASDITYIVGSCFFVQANNDGTMTMDYYDATPGTLKAPQRAAVATEEFKVRLGKTTEDYVDQLFVSASEDATDTYQTGHDLRKCTIDSKGAKVAQMTVNGYGMSLCDAEFPLVNNTAIFPLTLTSPKAEAYTLYIARQPENATLYLMQNGSIIWNLTTSPFVIDLPQGSETSYSLMIVNAAQTPTDVETVSGERLEVSGVQKIILNEHVYILRDGKMYDAAGAVVR